MNRSYFSVQHFPQKIASAKQSFVSHSRLDPSFRPLASIAAASASHMDHVNVISNRCRLCCCGRGRRVVCVCVFVRLLSTPRLASSRSCLAALFSFLCSFARKRIDDGRVCLRHCSPRVTSCCGVLRRAVRCGICCACVCLSERGERSRLLSYFPGAACVCACDWLDSRLD